jgi:putative transposase
VRPVAPATWGGRRAGAGRKRKPAKDRTFVPHHARPVHKKRHPTHVTLRARKGLPSFRSERVHALLRRILENQTRRRYRDDFQVVQYSIQSNHLHLIVESTDKRSMRSGVSGLVIAFAKRLNACLRRLTGKVWGHRYHARDLTTPSEVRSALVYLLQNYKKHGYTTYGPVVDPLSSALYFDGWTQPVATDADASPLPRRPPRTWLLGGGWTRARGGLLSPTERPQLGSLPAYQPLRSPVRRALTSSPSRPPSRPPSPPRRPRRSPSASSPTASPSRARTIA